MPDRLPVLTEFDPARIDHVREKLEDEDYTINSLQIALRVIDIELALQGES